MQTVHGIYREATDDGHVYRVKSLPNGTYRVTMLFNGEVISKLLCDTFEDALQYIEDYKELA